MCNYLADCPTTVVQCVLLSDAFIAPLHPLPSGGSCCGGSAPQALLAAVIVVQLRDLSCADAVAALTIPFPLLPL